MKKEYRILKFGSPLFKVHTLLLQERVVCLCFQGKWRDVKIDSLGEKYDEWKEKYNIK